MSIDTNVMFNKKDIGKNLYRKKTYYTLVIEQEVLAKDKDEADKLFEECGIDHSQINHEITETKNGVETYMVDADYLESNDTEYYGKVVYNEDNEYAKEDGDVEIDTLVSETDVHTTDGYQEYTVKEGEINA
jgi:hypothetical protein